MTNAERTYDPFPRSGLVKQYEPFIRKYVSDYCDAYPHVDRMRMLCEAVYLAEQAARAFNPDLGCDFSTLLRQYLKALNKADAEEKGWSGEEPVELWFPKADDSPRLKTPAGANGARLHFDKWKLADDQQRRGVVVAFRSRSNDPNFVRPLSTAVSGAVGRLLDTNLPVAIRVAIEHHDRKLREAEYGIRLEAQPIPAAVEYYEARTPRMSLIFPDDKKVDGLRRSWEDDFMNALGYVRYTKIYKRPVRLSPRGVPGGEIEWCEDRFDEAKSLIWNALKPEEQAVMLWMGSEMFNLDPETERQLHFVKYWHPPRISANELALQIGRTKKTVYNIRSRVIARIKRALRNR